MCSCGGAGSHARAEVSGCKYCSVDERMDWRPVAMLQVGFVKERKVMRGEDMREITTLLRATKLEGWMSLSIPLAFALAPAFGQ